MAPQSRDFNATCLTTVMGEITRNPIRLPAVEKRSSTTLSVLHTLTYRVLMRLTALKVTGRSPSPLSPNSLVGWNVMDWWNATRIPKTAARYSSR